jgi:hypothetical protein
VKKWTKKVLISKPPTSLKLSNRVGFASAGVPAVKPVQKSPEKVMTFRPFTLYPRNSSCFFLQALCLTRLPSFCGRQHRELEADNGE